MRTLPVAVLLTLAACASPPAAPPASDALVDVWASVPLGQAELAALDVPAVCDVPFGTWFVGFGVRGLACAADRALPLGGVAARAPGPVWTSGPHRLDGTALRLDLRAPRAFGHYDPAFVAWAARNAVPESPAARRATQLVYDRAVRRLARVYWLAHQDLAAEGFPGSLPAGPARDYAAFLEGGAVPAGASVPGGESEGGVSVFLLFDDRALPVARRITQGRGGEGVVGDYNEWEVRYEANTAVGFWLRRRADGTAGAFRDGLERLLATYDGLWLVSAQE